MHDVSTVILNTSFHHSALVLEHLQYICVLYHFASQWNACVKYHAMAIMLSSVTSIVITSIFAYVVLLYDW